MAGLTIGLSIGILILLWVNDERSYDNFHPKGDDIYRLETWDMTRAMSFPSDGEMTWWVWLDLVMR